MPVKVKIPTYDGYPLQTVWKGIKWCKEDGVVYWMKGNECGYCTNEVAKACNDLVNQFKLRFSPLSTKLTAPPAKILELDLLSESEIREIAKGIVVSY